MFSEPVPKKLFDLVRGIGLVRAVDGEINVFAVTSGERQDVEYRRRIGGRFTMTQPDRR